MHMLQTLRLSLLSIATAAASMTSLSAHAVSQYTVTNLGAPPGGSYFVVYTPNGLSDNGTIVGYGNSSSTTRGAFQWSGGTFTALNQLSSVSGANKAGTIVGSSASGQAVALNQGTATVLPNLPGASTGTASAINQAGTIAGQSGNQAVIWKNGQVQALGEAPAEGISQRVSAINDNGQVLGTIGPTYGTAHGLVIWNTDGTVTELGEPPVGYEPTPYDLNNAGVAVGVSLGIHSQDPVVWRNGVAEALPRLNYDDGAAHAINDAGLIVGASYGYSDAYALATLWQDGKAYDLNTLLVDGQGPYDLRDAIAINASGQILASAGWSGGNLFLLTPVPEPETYALFGVGLLSLMLVRRKPASDTSKAAH
jgi:probable HAF family extracellular repeat protein